ncbi:MAG: GNAT family N-acetyltransferase [Syntrophobacterales bacterium]|jgi:GNAT superfamily N-acetyltransferase
MIIREATQSDANGIAKVHVDCWRSTYDGIVPGDFLADLSYLKAEKFWNDVLIDSDLQGFVYVAENDAGQIVGYIAGGPEREGNRPYEGEFYSIYILKEFQGQSIGRSLIAAASKKLLQSGLKSVMLWTFAVNPYRGFFESLGGQVVSEETIEIGGSRLVQVAYGWSDVSELAAKSE